MGSLFLILACFCCVGAMEMSCSANYCSESKLHKFAEASKNLTFHLLNLQMKRNPTKSLSIAPVPILCMLAQLADQAKGDNLKNILKIFDVQTKKEAMRYLMLANEVIEGYKNREKVDYDVYADTTHPFSRKFRRNFACQCGGLTHNIDFSKPRKAAYTVNQIFKSESSKSKGRSADVNMFKKNGVIFGASFRLALNLNHENNPTGLVISDFVISKDKVKKMLFLHGNAYVEYAEIAELDAKIIKLYFSEDEYHGILIWPNNPDNLSCLVERLQDEKVYNKAVAALKPMCAKLKLVIGAANMVNKLRPYLRSLVVELNNYHGIYENNDSGADVSNIIQEVYLSATKIEPRADINSPKCRAGCFQEITMASPVFYQFRYKFCAVAAAGVFLGDTYGGDT